MGKSSFFLRCNNGEVKFLLTVCGLWRRDGVGGSLATRTCGSVLLFNLQGSVWGLGEGWMGVQQSRSGSLTFCRVGIFPCDCSAESADDEVGFCFCFVSVCCSPSSAAFAFSKFLNLKLLVRSLSQIRLRRPREYHHKKKRGRFYPFSGLSKCFCSYLCK